MADGNDRKSALIAQLAAQRTRLSRHAQCVQVSLDVGGRIKASFAGNRVVWLAGAAFAGLALARFRIRKPAKSPTDGARLRTAARAGFAWPAVKLVLDLARPALVSLLTARIADFAAGHATQRRGGSR